jgi:hypothetical protein
VWGGRRGWGRGRVRGMDGGGWRGWWQRGGGGAGGGSEAGAGGAGWGVRAGSIGMGWGGPAGWMGVGGEGGGSEGGGGAGGRRVAGRGDGQPAGDPRPPTPDPRAPSPEPRPPRPDPLRFRTNSHPSTELSRFIQPGWPKRESSPSQEEFVQKFSSAAGRVARRSATSFRDSIRAQFRRHPWRRATSSGRHAPSH